MKFSTQIKSISYLKANAAEVVRQLAEQRKPLVITQNGEAKAVIQDVTSYEETQETLALLKILALGNRQIEEGKVVSATDAIRRLREKESARLMRHEVSLTADAERDLEEMYDYIAAHDSPAKADYVLDRVEEVVEGLSTFPERGSYPKELAALGMREYRQTFFKPYRVIYRVLGQHVYIFLIANGRRDIQTLLARRLFGM